MRGPSQRRYWWELPSNMFDPTARRLFVRKIVNSKMPLEFDAELSFVTAEVER